VLMALAMMRSFSRMPSLFPLIVEPVLSIQV